MRPDQQASLVCNGLERLLRSPGGCDLDGRPRETLKLVGTGSKCMIALKDPEGEVVRLHVFDTGGQLIDEDSLPPGKGLTGRVMREGESLMVGSLQDEISALGLAEEYNDPRIQSWMGTPLTVHGEVVGMLNVQAEVEEAYDEDQLRVFETIASQVAVAIQNARLYQLATVDGLTGLYVRRYFDLRIEEEWQEARRYDGDFAVLFLDLDDFKLLNDTHGHQVGDEVLKVVADVMHDCMREADIPCRYGGEEFAAIMPRTDLESAIRVAERIRAGVAEREIVAAALSVQVTVSVGVAAWLASGRPRPRELVRLADQALYAAKAHGKNRVEPAAGAQAVDAGAAMS